MPQSCVSSLYCFTLQFAPPFGTVVLIHKLPVGAGVVSLDLYSGTLVCGAIATFGATLVPSAIPAAASGVLVPSASTIFAPVE